MSNTKLTAFPDMFHVNEKLTKVPCLAVPDHTLNNRNAKQALCPKTRTQLLLFSKEQNLKNKNQNKNQNLGFKDGVGFHP